jgi:aryl-alcohol dehydrogenase-like predicted oxidoreductase
MNSNITKRQLGQSGIFINPMGLGLMSLSGIYGASDDENATNLIRQAIDMGVDFID